MGNGQWTSIILYYGITVGKYDYGRRLSDVVGVHRFTARTVQTILTFVGESEKPIVRKFSDMFSYDRSEIQKIWEYLAQRHYRTFKSDVISNILSDARPEWDVPSKLQTYLEIISNFSVKTHAFMI